MRCCSFPALFSPTRNFLPTIFTFSYTTNLKLPQFTPTTFFSFSFGFPLSDSRRNIAQRYASSDDMLGRKGLVGYQRKIGLLARHTFSLPFVHSGRRTGSPRNGRFAFISWCCLFTFPPLLNTTSFFFPIHQRLLQISRRLKRIFGIILLLHSHSLVSLIPPGLLFLLPLSFPLALFS